MKMIKPKFRIVRGLPGSGKSTFARKFGAILIESDQALFFGGEYTWTQENLDKAIKWVREMVAFNFPYGHDITVCGVFANHNRFQWHVQEAKRNGYDVEVYRCVSDFGNIHNVPENVLDSMKNAFTDYKGEIIVEAGEIKK